MEFGRDGHDQAPRGLGPEGNLIINKSRASSPFTGLAASATAKMAAKTMTTTTMARN
ncbi:hypothetical protein HPP92_001267 [Vanilla planifolia]|uniref:Uncharacterized protein n=1 Tax=Vanilla planifolia TaxID=51239 RepID=A0A835RXV3_VANPL|nr:hypothetical protein HPP92_001267 [Vanilla planifolia]